MKKIIVLAALLLTAVTQAQSIIVFSDDAQINDGDVIVYEELGAEAGYLRLQVQNTSNQSISLKLKMDSIENGDNLANEDGVVQFCFGGYCYYTVSEGTAAPNNPDNSGLTLAPGGVNDNGDHFVNAYPGDDGTGVIYNMSFIQVDAEGNQVGDALLSFQYKYEPQMGIEDFASLQNMGININNTVVKNTFDLNTTVNTTMEVYAINGQLIKSVNLKTGAQSVDLSALNSGIYITRFTTEDKRTSQVRIVKN